MDVDQRLTPANQGHDLDLVSVAEHGLGVLTGEG